ncbi:MAG: alpha/beta fold hydrolase [Litorivicinaceae bacterium]
MPNPSRLTAANTSFPLVAAGSGSPILFVHGSWADLRIWCGLWERIAEKHEFLAITQRHFGCDDWPKTKPFSRDVHTNDLIALVKALDKPVHLVGWSYAGGILLRTAAEVPEMIRSIAIYEPSFESEAPPVEGELRCAREAFWAELEPAYVLAQSGNLDSAMRSGVEIVFGLEKGGFESLDSRFQRVFLDNAHTMIPDLEAAAPKPLTEAELEKVTCPALIIYGERTYAQYRLMADSTIESLPNALARQIADVGHGGPVQVPDLFADEVLSFVAAASA